MKPYFDISEIPSLHPILSKLIDCVNVDTQEFIENLLPSEQIKYENILNKEFVKMYYIPIKYTEAEGLPKRNMDEIFNFSVDSVEQNQENGKGIYAKEIQKCVDPNYYPCNLPFFSKTLSAIPNIVHSSWVIFYKKDAKVRPHHHDDTTILTHILLHDIKDGEFVVTVKGKEKRINEKGEYFIFCGGDTHSAFFTGQEARFITLSVELKDINR